MELELFSAWVSSAQQPLAPKIAVIRRDTSVTPDKVSTVGRVPVRFYSATVFDITLACEVLKDFAVEDRTRKLDLLWKVSWPRRSPRPGWSGMMQSACNGSYHGQSSFTFLPMIDMDPTNMSCIYSTLPLCLIFGKPVCLHTSPDFRPAPLVEIHSNR